MNSTHTYTTSRADIFACCCLCLSFFCFFLRMCMHERVVRYWLPFRSQVHSAAFDLHALFIMPKRTHMQQLEATLHNKVQRLGRAKARKKLVDSQYRLLEDAVEHYCKVIAMARRKQLRKLAKAEDASSRDSSGDGNGEEAIPEREPAVLPQAPPARQAKLCLTPMTLWIDGFQQMAHGKN